MSEGEVERAIATLKKIVEAAENANHAGEVAAVMAVSAPALVEALEFYADREADGYEVHIADYGLRAETGRIIKDGGETARRALEDASERMKRLNRIAVAARDLCSELRFLGFGTTAAKALPGAFDTLESLLDGKEPDMPVTPTP